MKTPFYNQEERELMLTDTFIGASLRLNKAALTFRKSMHNSYGRILGEIGFRWAVKLILKPHNEQMKHNWNKSDGRHV